MIDFFQNLVGGGQNGLGDGATIAAARVGKTSELITGHAHAKYHEAASRQNVFTACNQVAVTFGTALTATAVTFTLTNPVGSGVLLSILHCGLTFVTSTTAGSIVYALNAFSANQAAVTQGTPGSVRSTSGSAKTGQGLFATAATLPAAPVAIRTLAFGQVTALATSGAIHDYVDGAICLIPGTAITMQGITIVGTGLFDMQWEEVPLNQ